MITATCLGTCSSVSPRNGVGLLSHREIAPRGTPNRPENPNNDGNSRVWSSSSSSPSRPDVDADADADAVSSARAPPKGRCPRECSRASSSAASSRQVDARRATFRDPRRLDCPPRLEGRRRARDVAVDDERASTDINDARDIARVGRSVVARESDAAASTATTTTRGQFSARGNETTTTIESKPTRAVFRI